MQRQFPRAFPGLHFLVARLADLHLGTKSEDQNLVRNRVGISRIRVALEVERRRKKVVSDEGRTTINPLQEQVENYRWKKKGN